MLFTSVTTNSSRRDKELLEKDTIPMETESTRTRDKSASGKANDVNNAKKIKAYMDKVYTAIEHSNICVDVSYNNAHLKDYLHVSEDLFGSFCRKGNTITAILHKKPLITVFESL
ncbi:hypothetical protein YC2023_093460 [Brassica napus]